MIKSIALGLAALAIPAAGFASAQNPAPAAAPALRVEGTWTGPFAQHDWTFELKQENGAWSGRYMAAEMGRWQELQAVAVTAASVTFTIPSSPPLKFVLAPNRAHDQLSGDIHIGDLTTMPFSASRRP